MLVKNFLNVDENKNLNVCWWSMLVKIFLTYNCIQILKHNIPPTYGFLTSIHVHQHYNSQKGSLFRLKTSVPWLCLHGFFYDYGKRNLGKHEGLTARHLNLLDYRIYWNSKIHGLSVHDKILQYSILYY